MQVQYKIQDIQEFIVTQKTDLNARKIMEIAATNQLDICAQQQMEYPQLFHIYAYLLITARAIKIMDYYVIIQAKKSGAIF